MSGCDRYQGWGEENAWTPRSERGELAFAPERNLFANLRDPRRTGRGTLLGVKWLLSLLALVGLASSFSCSENNDTDPGTSLSERSESGNSVSDSDPSARHPDGWKDEFAPPSVDDLDPDPNVLEVEIEARVDTVQLSGGVETEMWTYNGSVPGPLLRAQVGDRLVVHFTNNLPEATTIHWHGLRVPSDMDGTEAVQAPVEPGESFTYDFTLPDAGTFWYHPHMNSGAQVGYGLYGPIVVEDPHDGIEAEDAVLLLSDASLDGEGGLLPGDHQEWFGDYFGREGETLLVNGRVEPTLRLRPGVPVRLRIINAARSRFFGTSIEGAEMIRLGSDAGLSNRALRLDELVVVPSERLEVLVTLEESAPAEIAVPFVDTDRFGVGVPIDELPLFRIERDGDYAEVPLALPDPLRAFDSFDENSLEVRTISLGETSEGQMTINGVVFPGLENTPHVGYVGDSEIWEVENTTGFQHPFHLHGFAFEVLDVGGVPWPAREWKDTVNIPANQTLRFVVTYDERPGLWMFHCHILGHAKLGMMSLLDIRERR